MLLSPKPTGVVAFLPFHPPSPSRHSFLSFTPPPTPPPSTLKRTRPDSPTIAHLQPPNKKRRLRLVAPSSRLADHFFEPTVPTSTSCQDTIEPKLRYPPPHTSYGPGFPRRPASSLRHSQTSTALAPMPPGSVAVPQKFLLRKAAILNAIRTAQIAAMRCRERQKQIMMAQVAQAQAQAAQMRVHPVDRVEGRALDVDGRKENGNVERVKNGKEEKSTSRRKPKRESKSKQTNAKVGNGGAVLAPQTGPTAVRTEKSTSSRSKVKATKRESTSTVEITDDPSTLIAIPIKLKRRRRTKAEIASDLAAAAAMAASNRAATNPTLCVKLGPGPGKKKQKPPPAPEAPEGGRGTTKMVVDPLLIAIPVHRRPPSPPSEAELEAERRRIGVARMEEVM